MGLTKVLVLGAGGMLGNAVYRSLATATDVTVVGTVRRLPSTLLPVLDNARLVGSVDAADYDALVRLMASERPAIVINCVGHVKQSALGNSVLDAVPINSLLPHRLAELCQLIGARLILFSTDCVFSGSRGGYTESDLPDPVDVYGRSKLLGEVDAPGVVTLRTSIIGHEIGSRRGLIDWFLSQEGSVDGFRQAIFSGLPTVVLADVLKTHVLPNIELAGVYHVSAAPISKFELLSLVSRIYGKKIIINPSDSMKIDRSLDSSRFRSITGYVPATWPQLVQVMHDYYKNLMGKAK
jgi:dTDP-4-dehydrorhamnose reductase